MSSRLRLTRPTALLAAVVVVLVVGGGASALALNTGVSVSQSLPPVQGDVELCLLGMDDVCVGPTGEPLADGGTLTVTAASSASHTEPELMTTPTTCPSDQPGTAIAIKTAGATATVTATVEGPSALTGDPQTLTIGPVEIPALTQEIARVCIKPVKIG